MSFKYTSKLYNVDLQETTNESSLVVGGEKGSRFVLFSELYRIKRQCLSNFAAAFNSILLDNLGTCTMKFFLYTGYSKKSLFGVCY